MEPCQMPHKRVFVLLMLNLLLIAPGEAKANPALTIWSLRGVHQRVWAWKGAVSTSEALPYRSILGDFPSLPTSRTSLPYSTTRVAVPSLLIQRLLLKTFPTGLPVSAGARQGKKTLTAERRRWERPVSVLQPGLPLPTRQRWLVWWGSGGTEVGLAPWKYRGILLLALILRWYFWLPPICQDAPELKSKKTKVITLFKVPQKDLGKHKPPDTLGGTIRYLFWVHFTHMIQ